MRLISRFQPLIVVCAMTCAFFGCTTEGPLDDTSKEPTEEPGQTPEDNPDNPGDEKTEGYERLTLSSGANNQNLTFEWSEIDIESEETNFLSFFISDGEKPVSGKLSDESGAPDNEMAYSGLAVTPHAADARGADFKTVDYYDVSKFATPSYCYVVAGSSPIQENVSSGQNLFHIEMPSSFVQTSTDNPDFLKEHMSMYASALYEQNATKLDFQQVPAVLKLKVKNTTASTITLQEVSIRASQASIAQTKSADLPFMDDNLLGDELPSVASSSVDLSFDWKNGNVQLAFAKEGYNEITVATADGVSLNGGEAYTAYTVALPLSDDNAFADKNINILVKTNNYKYVALRIDRAKLAELNGSDVYNWIGGKTYTIEVDLTKDGSATGRILSGNRLEVTSSLPGKYVLMYEGNDGKPLEDYSEICTLNVDQVAVYEDFIDVNVVPRSAECIGIYDSYNHRCGAISLSGAKPDYSVSPRYTFGLLSDVHIGRSASSEAEADFERALQYFQSKGVDMTCICGDATQNGNEAELQEFANIASKSSTPVYTTTGNHDCTGTDGVNPVLWEQYTGHPVVFEKSVEINGKTDHYLFMGMSYYNFIVPYLESHFNWLEDKLEEYRNERCFVFTHLFFPERAGNMNGLYPTGNWLRGTQHERLESMCKRYVNSIWFSGHSHWKWSLQKYQDRANIHRSYEAGQPMSAWCVHVPSCADPVNSTGSSRENVPAESEGSIVHVYDNHIDILGLDLLTGKYFPIATYRLDTSLKSVPERTTVRENHYLTASDFVVNESKPGASVKDVEGKPGYVEVTMTAKNQGFYVANSTYTANSSKVSIIVEDVQTFSNGEPVDVPANVGFYGGKYYLVTTNAATVSNGDNPGVQFQSSNSKYEGPTPLTILMKTQMVFCEE